MSYLKKYSSIIIGYFNYQNNHAAALAYYSLFALIPIAFVSFSLFGRIFGQETIEQILIRFLSNQVGLKDTAAIVEFFTNTQFTKPNIWMELLSVVAIIVTTSAMTSSVKRGVNDILDVPIKKNTCGLSQRSHPISTIFNSCHCTVYTFPDCGVFQSTFLDFLA